MNFETSSFQTLSVNLDQRGILTVELNRPDIRNAFNETMIAELTEVFSTEVLKPEVRLVLLKGNGKVFCAGGDLNWMKKSVEMSFEDNLKDTEKLTEMFALMNECPKPMIGKVHGAAIGGGVGLVSVCDIVLSSSETVFSLSEVRLGIIPACIGPFVIAKIGATHARHLFTSAERFPAKKALDIGLIHEVLPNDTELDARLEILIKNMLECGPNAMAAAKRLVLDLSWPERRSQQPDCLKYVAKMLAELRISPEGQEGVRAFLEKRKPTWLLK
jgi:methylglutaconyl-CoA hydratase